MEGFLTLQILLAAAGQSQGPHDPVNGSRQNFSHQNVFGLRDGCSLFPIAGAHAVIR